MCGICGIIYKKPNEKIGENIAAINHKIKHRGPDDEGYALFSPHHSPIPLFGHDSIVDSQLASLAYTPIDSIYKNRDKQQVALAHRRLSIIDLSAKGHQPMCSADQRYWIVYNGEIYNFKEIRNELIQLGFYFVSDTDTEVLLNAYIAWGTNCLQRLNGMWAFVIFDNLTQQIFGARDRLGVKPLYYYIDHEKFVFASEQKAFTAIPEINISVNNRAVYDYLILSHAQPESEGFFKNIFELPTSHFFHFNCNDFVFKTEKYYSIKIKEDKISFGDCTEKLQQLLTKAVQIRTHADVPVGSCLSGGLDSSTIVMLASKYMNESSPQTRNQHVFTASYAGYSIDESNWAEQIATAAGAEWHKTYPKPTELLSDIDAMVYAAGTPLFSTSTYAQYRVMKLASEHGLKVLLDGQGADELLGGYKKFFGVYWTELLFKAQWGKLHHEIDQTKLAGYNYKQWLAEGAKGALMHLPSSMLAAFYKGRVSELKYIQDDFFQSYVGRFGKIKEPYQIGLNKVLQQYTSGENLQVMLNLEDRMSMNFSIESRTPFADDKDLIDFAFTIPASYKIKDGMGKFIMREAMKGILPESVRLRRDKVGFQTPEHQWMQTLTVNIQDYISLELNRYIDYKKLIKDLPRIIETPTSTMNNRVLRYVFLSSWLKQYNLKID